MYQETAPFDYPDHMVPFLKGVEKGYDVDIRTPLFEGRNRDEVADQCMEQVINSAPEMYPELLKLERSQRTKIGPLSRRLPFLDRIEDVKSYYTAAKSIIKLSELQVPTYVMGNLRGGRLRPLNARDSAYLLPDDSNSGLPLFARRSKVLDQSVSLAEEGQPYPAILGWRGQANGTDIPKQRVVWMFPYSTNIRENRYFRPLHDLLVKSTPHFSAWISMDEVDRSVSAMLELDQMILSSDFSGFDQSVKDQQAWYFEFLAGMYQRQYHEDIEWLEHNLRNIELLCTTTIQLKGKHGMPSGSNFTNQADSLINLFAQTSSPVANYLHLLQVQGDDALVMVDDLDAHLEHLRTLGFEVNADKQTYSTNEAHYLQRLYLKQHKVDGIHRGIYPIMRALNSLLGQERFYEGWDSRMVSLRVLMILENCKWHPEYVPFVKFVLKFGDPKLKELVNSLSSGSTVKALQKQASGIAGLVPTYNQESGLGGIVNFTSVKLISSL